MRFCDHPDCDCALRCQSYLAGDHAACDRMIKRLMPYLAMVARHKLPNPSHEDCQDIAQEVISKVFADGALKTWKERGRFCVWIKMVAARCAIDHGRKDDVRASIWAGAVLPGEIGDKTSRSYPEEVWEVVDRVLSEVPEREGRAFRLLIGGMGPMEVAQKLGVSVESVFNWRRKIRARLKPFFEK